MPEPLVIDTTASVVWKFELPGPRCGVLMPAGAQIQKVALLDGEIVLWAAVNPDAAETLRLFESVNTGTPFTDRRRTYLGTVWTDDVDRVVWHVYELGTPRPSNPVVSNRISGHVLGGVVQAVDVGEVRFGH